MRRDQDTLIFRELFNAGLNINFELVQFFQVSLEVRFVIRRVRLVQFS